MNSVLEPITKSSQYQQPEHNKEKFNCPHCNIFTNHAWIEELYDEDGGLFYIQEETISASICSACDSTTFWVKNQIIYPQLRAAPHPNSDLPDDITEIYEQAAAIAHQSSIAACALLRLAAEKLIQHLGGKGTLNESIGNMVKKGLSPQIQQSLDILRITGNNAIHAGLIIFEDKTNVQHLFHIINTIAHVLITQPKETESLYNQLPENSKEEIKRRDDIS
ncbi:MAG: DUF4145 domain-containing protein [Candidatus Poribacteria bacterium]|nr:DUF4145 domain-containing protein [Candidatus Poribacteria bacterium]